MCGSGRGPGRAGRTRPRRPARRKRMRLLTAGVVLADLVVLAATVLLAWDLRFTIDIWSALVATDPEYPTAGAWIVLAWLAILAAQGSYSLRIYGTGPAEFRRRRPRLADHLGPGRHVLLPGPARRSRAGSSCSPSPSAPRRCSSNASWSARSCTGSGSTAACCTGWSPSGTQRHRRDRGRPRARELRRATRSSAPASPSGGTGPPRRGCPCRCSAAPPTCGEVCERIGADTVLVTRGGYDSSRELRRIAWALEGSDMELVVVPSLTDIAGPRISMRPVAGLPLLHVEQPQAGEAGGLAKRVFDVAVAAVLAPGALAGDAGRCGRHQAARRRTGPVPAGPRRARRQHRSAC